MQGRKVLNYTLLRLLGRGGMAEVWYAENQIGKRAAVKILNKDLSLNEPIVERFRNEAKVTVQLSHPNIRRVDDYDELDGRPCMVMEYLEGGDLGARMKGGERFTDAQLHKWWDQLVSALNYTHAQGIVHRDIKPSNIFITNDGDVKLLDFGIAKVRDSITATQTGAMMGTLMYMSPEQVRDSKHVDRRTDVYSLAVTFVHLLSGCAPYDFDTTDDFEIRENIVRKPLDLSKVPADWQRFLKPYLAKNPADRPEVVPFFAQAKPKLEAVADDKTLMDNTLVEKATSREPSKPKPEQPAVASPRNPRKADAQIPAPNARKRLPWIIGGSVAAAVLLALVLILTFAKKDTEDTPSAEDKTFTVGNVTFIMKKVEGGAFTMGTTQEQESGTKNDEKPAHVVIVSDFYMGKTEVTQALWKAVMGTTIRQQRDKANPDWALCGKGSSYPIYYVNWDEAVQFCNQLNSLLSKQLPSGYKFALPTEAEWEYAARGGKYHSGYKYSGSDNIDEVAWCWNLDFDIRSAKMHPVKRKNPNALGLYDMTGNVEEWCSDWYDSAYYSVSPLTDPQGPSSGSRRVMRGGNWNDDGGDCRVARRNYKSPNARLDWHGFRIALVRR